MFGGFGEGFLRRFGGFLGLLGMVFGIIFACLYLECSLEGILEAPGRDFVRIAQDLGGVFEKVWGVKFDVFSLLI